MHGARRGAPVPTPVVQLDLHAFDDGALERLEMVGRGGHGVVPAGGVVHDRTGGRLGVVAEGHREGVHELAQGRPDLGCGAGGPGDEEERAGLVGGQPAQVRPGAADQLPAAAPPGLGVDGDAGQGESLEVAAGRPLADLELPGQLGRGDAALGLQDQEGGDEAICADGSLPRKVAMRWPLSGRTMTCTPTESAGGDRPERR